MNAAVRDCHRDMWILSKYDTAASTEANTRVRRCLAYASSQASSQRAREDELGKWARWWSGGRIHYFNYSFGYQDTNTKIPIPRYQYQDTNTKIPRSVLWEGISLYHYYIIIISLLYHYYIIIGIICVLHSLQKYADRFILSPMNHWT